MHTPSTGPKPCPPRATNPSPEPLSPSITVYLLHFETPFKHARHYLGATVNLERRLHLHQTGQGARLLRAVLRAGIHWTLARTWKADFGYEKTLKARKNTPQLCPICIQARLLAEGRC